MSSKKILDDNYVEKKFENLTSSSEVIQNLSHWALSHKSHHEKIVSIWFKVLKKCDISFFNAIYKTLKCPIALYFLIQYISDKLSSSINSFKEAK